VADNEERAYVGYRSAGRRPESRNDRVAAANAPLNVLRGWAAGTLGLPGDIESLVRLLPGLSEKNVLPTTEYFEERLPLRDMSPTGRAFTGAGTLSGGAGVATGARAASRGAQALAPAAGALAMRAAEVGGMPVHGMGIVKPAGNLNFTPLARAEILKGSETQTAESFLNQLRGKPGVTKEGFDQLAKRYQGLEPNTRMTKAEFEQLVPPSRYNLVDLANSSESADAHLMTMAEERVMEDRYLIYEGMLDRLGVRASDANADHLSDYHNGYATFDSLPESLKRALKKAEMDTPEGRGSLDDLFAEKRDEAINATYENYREYGDVAPEGYAYREYQRLLNEPDLTHENYVEKGVSHPEQTGEYKHYAEHEGDGLIGHMRGTLIPADADERARTLLMTGTDTHVAKPNSFLIEEIQSDVQKKKHLSPQEAARRAGIPSELSRAVDNWANFSDIGGSYGLDEAGNYYRRTGEMTPELQKWLDANNVSDRQQLSDLLHKYSWEQADTSGPLHQVHGTVFKSAIQHALNQGADTVYYPTSKIIGAVRRAEPSDYASIYDQQIMKEGLKPLLKIPGVTASKIGDSYHEINFSPEAKEFILRGEGQTAPGYSQGGLVGTQYNPLEADYVFNNVNGYAQGGSVGHTEYDPLQVDLIVDDLRGYAEGGSVESAHTSYDEAKISSLVNALREELNA
jgi:hypothetical protein